VGKRKGVHTGVWWENMRVRDHFEDLVLNGRIILKCIFKKSGVDWISLVQGREEKWWVVVEAAISLGFSKTRGISRR
jgi:hypothetical protein